MQDRLLMFHAGAGGSQTLRIWLLGQFRLEVGGRQLTCVRPRCETLLAYLLLHPRRTESRRHVAFLLWPDSTERQALTNLRHVLHDLRSALPGDERFLTVTGQMLEWNPDLVYLDVAHFRHCSRPDAAPVELEEALALYQDDLLPACYDDWIAIERERLRQMYFSVVERLAHLREASQDFRAALDLAQHLLSYDPLREATYRLLIRLHAANDDRGAALEVYQACVAMMKQELGVAPSESTRALHRKLLISSSAADH